MGKFTIFAQLCNHIPGHVVAKLARETGVGAIERTVSAWSHVVADALCATHPCHQP